MGAKADCEERFPTAGPLLTKKANLDLVAAHWRDLMRVSIAICEGTLASPLLLRRLGSNSHRNQIYRAFREVGRAVATVQLLRFISDPSLRRGKAIRRYITEFGGEYDLSLLRVEEDAGQSP